MKEFYDAVNSRFKSPFFSYSILAFFAWNWKGIFLLIVTDGDPQLRLDAFDSATNIHTLIIYPLSIGILVAASNNWLKYFFGWISRKPIELMDLIHIESEHKKTIRQYELEQFRSKIFGLKEDDLIDRAKRDEEVSKIEDEDTKEKLIEQLNEIRKERDSLTEKLEIKELVEIKTVENMTEEASELIKAASKNQNGTIRKIETMSEKSIQAGTSHFGNENKREFVRYEKALDEISLLGLVKAGGQNGEIFYLTHDGWEVADHI